MMTGHIPNLQTAQAWSRKQERDSMKVSSDEQGSNTIDILWVEFEDTREIDELQM
jgi:hypothetical protein